MNKTNVYRMGVGVLLMTSVLMHERASQAESDMNARHAAFKDCASSLGLPTPGPGSARPTEDQMKSMNACMQSKGFSAPEHHPPLSAADKKKMDACLSEAGVTPPTFTPGQAPPKLDDATRDAMHACAKKLGLPMGHPPGPPPTPAANNPSDGHSD